MQGVDLLLFGFSIAGGVLGGMLFSWRLNRRCYRVECEVADLADTILRDKKKRAAHTRWSEQDELELLLKNPPANPKSSATPWAWAQKREKQ